MLYNIFDGRKTVRIFELTGMESYNLYEEGMENSLQFLNEDYYESTSSRDMLLILLYIFAIYPTLKRVSLSSWGVWF